MSLVGAGACAGVLIDEARVGLEAAEGPIKAHTGLFVQLSLGCLRHSLGQREGAASGKLTDGDASQGPGAGSTVCHRDLLTRVYPASRHLCAHAGTHPHAHRLPGVAPSVSLTASPGMSVGPGLPLS